MLKSPLILAGAAGAALLFTTSSCITETNASYRQASGLSTQGVVLSLTPDALWQRARAVVGGMTAEPLVSQGLERSLATTVRGAEVKVLVEPHTRGAALHITSSDQAVADEIRMRCMF